MPAQKFLNHAEQQRVIQAVAKVESTTTGEIVPMIVPASGDYHAASFAGAITLTIPLSIIISLIGGYNTVWTYAAVVTLVHLTLYYLFDHFPKWRRPFIKRRDMEAKVEEAAHNSFFQHNLHTTNSRSGVLIYISLYEHSVQVLADKGIYDKVTPATWQQFAHTVTAGIANSTPADALCDAIAQCGELLAHHAPARGKSTNELPNLIINGRNVEG